MKDFNLVSVTSVPLTQELAKKYSEMEASATERPLSQSRVTYLKDKILAGLGIPFFWVTIETPEGRTKRLNGQHSSKAVLELDGAMPNDLTVVQAHYKAETPQGEVLLYRQFDDRKSGRSPIDIAHAYHGMQPSLAEVDTKIAKLGIEGVVWWRKNIEGIPVPSGDDQYSLFALTGLHTFLLWLGEVFSIKTPEFGRVPIVAAMYATFNAGEAQAREFWAKVGRGGDQYDENAPTTVLDEWLKELKEDAEKARKMKPGDYYQGCIYAWNANRDGKAIKDIKHEFKKKGFMQVL